MNTANLPAARAPESSATVSGYRRPLWELLIGYGLLQAALWTEGEMRWLWAIATAMWMVGVTVYHRPKLRELGLGWGGFQRSLWIVAAAGAAGAVMLFAAQLTGTLHRYALHRSLVIVAVGYLLWTVQQQFMLQSFFFLRLEQLLTSRKAVWATAGLFALAHFPNPVLVPATWVAGLAFCELFRRYRNIYTLAIAQAILGMCLAAAVPEALHHHMRVGIGYLSWIGR
jgi:Type II CAAX prenyl endopeptidase Rce1-like